MYIYTYEVHGCALKLNPEVRAKRLYEGQWMDNILQHLALRREQNLQLSKSSGSHTPEQYKPTPQKRGKTQWKLRREEKSEIQHTQKINKMRQSRRSSSGGGGPHGTRRTGSTPSFFSTGTSGACGGDN